MSTSTMPVRSVPSSRLQRKYTYGILQMLWAFSLADRLSYFLLLHPVFERKAARVLRHVGLHDDECGAIAPLFSTREEWMEMASRILLTASNIEEATVRLNALELAMDQIIPLYRKHEQACKWCSHLLPDW